MIASTLSRSCMFVLLALFLLISVVQTLPSGTTSTRDGVKNSDYKFSSVPLKTHKTVRPRNIQTATFRTILDHFTPQDPLTSDFTFEYNDEYHTPFMGPLFFFVQDFGEYTTQWIEEGLMVDIARDVGAALITTDLRYFGHNVPTPNATLENLQFLTVEQILTDIAFLITVAKTELSTYYSRVVVWGVGFGGTFASWARKKFPHLIDAAWSSSGIFPQRVFSESYYDGLSSNLRIYDEDGCAERVESAFAEIDNMIEFDDAELLQNTLDLCDPIDANSPNEIALLYLTFSGFISNYINEHHLAGLQNFCRDINAIPDNPLQSFADWVQFIYGANIPCFDTNFERMIENYSSDQWIQPGYGAYLGRQYFYIFCTQLATMATMSEYSVFPERVTEDYHRAVCEQILGDGFDMDLLQDAIYELNIQHGTVLPAATQIIYTNGLLYPFIYLGITTAQQGSYAINIPYHSRAADLTSIEPWESEELINAKQQIVDLIKSFV